MAPAEKKKTRRSKLMNFTEDENGKKARFDKRKLTMMKKASELSTLCDVNVCMVCFGPDETVETWPENKSDVLDLIGKYRGLSQESREKGKQKYDLSGFFEDKKRKLDEKLNKKRKNNPPGPVVSTWDERLNQFSEEELVGLQGNLDSKLQELREKIRVLQNNKVKGKAAEFQNHEVGIHQSNLNYDLMRVDDDSFYNQQINLANWPGYYHGGNNMSSNFGWSDSSEFGIPENLGFSDENQSYNHAGMVNMNNNLAFDNKFSLGFAHAKMGLRSEESFGLIGESSNSNNYFHAPPTSLLLQEVLPISMRPPPPPLLLPYSDQFSLLTMPYSDQFSLLSSS